jgi:hypothetical protein
MRTHVLVEIIAALWLSACASPPRYHKQPHPDDVEAAAPPVSSGACDGVQVIEAASLFAGDRQLSASRPANGSMVAIDGSPQPSMACTELGCDSECCNNECGFLECAYLISVDEQNRICLDREDFACGGTDCSGWCRPFTKTPSHRYRFVGELGYTGGEEFRSSYVGVRLAVQKYCRLD